jgi:hypothetical protein
VLFNTDTLSFTFIRDNAEWQSGAGRTEEADSAGTGSSPRLICKEGQYAFQDAASIHHEIRETGTGIGVYSTFSGFEGAAYTFSTYIWIERASGDVICEWIPRDEGGLHVTRVLWPGEFAFDDGSSESCSLLTHQQGVMLPNDWPMPVGNADIAFSGRFCMAGGYMPWFAQIRKPGPQSACAGYIAICETPWDAGYQIEHPAHGPYTHMGMRFEPSLGRMAYRRRVRYRFLSDCDHTAVCKAYREYVNGRGRLRTLREKAVRNPAVRDLIGSSWVHVGIKSDVQPESSFYDHDDPEANRTLVTFAQREEQIKALHAMGARKLYLHLDGWGEPGYDNRHPDYLPACAEAGGWNGIRSLIETCHGYGYMFGIHDQYRDYYYAARTFDERNAVHLPDGSIPVSSRWAGGKQTFLCAQLAPDYVRRNYAELRRNGIDLDCAYLDVFTCNEGDECADPDHRMTRRECYERRNECFEHLLAHGILPSSEEVSDWAVPSLVFCHYAPYDFQMREPGGPRQGIPVPLYNLVYHDCVIQPWMMEDHGDADDYMLYALLNGGAPYLVREGPAAGVDGITDDMAHATTGHDLERCAVVSAFHERVGMLELARHEFVGGDPHIQRSVFADGTSVTCDFRTQTYQVD